MQYVATIQVNQTRFMTRISDLLIAESGTGKVLVSATYLGGGLGGFAITDAALPITLGGLWDYPDGLGHMGDPEVQVMAVGGGVSVTLTGMEYGAQNQLPLLQGGTFGDMTRLFGPTPLPGDLTQLGQIEIGGSSFVYAARRGDVEFTLYREGANGSLTPVSRSVMPHALTMPDASLDKILSVDLGNQAMLIAISGQGNFLTSQRIDGQGNILRADYLKDKDGTGFNVPKDIAAVTVDGQVYLILTSARASSLTSIRLLPDGSMLPVDHVVDELSTRFQRATALATVELDGRAYVFVGGADDGITMFTVLPDGTLLHLETLVDDGQMTLADVSAISATAVGGKIALFVASATETGITQLVIDPGRIGQTDKAGAGIVLGTADADMLRAGRGTTQMKGGAGDDVLVSWRENIMLWGGAGRDVFVVTPILGRVLIWDYNPDEDRLDLSQLGMIRSIAQLSLTPFSKGIRIRFGDTLIEIHSADGGSITADRFSNLMFPVAHYTPPVVDTVIVGSAGNDFLSANRGGSEIYGLAGDDVILGNLVEDLLLGGEGNDTISAGAADDTVQGGDGNDMLRGGPGDDLIAGGIGHDMLIGDDGNDRLQGDDGDDTLFGGLGNDLLLGGAGNDYLSGDAGDDQLEGGGGNDSLSGGDGNDRLTITSGSGLLSGGAGNDTLLAGGGADHLAGGSGDDVIDSGAGDDVIEAGDGDDSILSGLGHDRIHADGGHDTADGGGGNDTICGGEGNDQLAGGTGDDVLYGGPGNDILLGQDGNDLIYAGFGDDQVFGGAGDDTLVGVAGLDRLDGGAGHDLIQGDGESDWLLGGEGNDTLFGHGGADLLEGGDGQDLLLAGSGADELLGGAGHDTLFGGDDADRLSGGDGHDILNGEAGDDLLDGGDGDDVLSGGDGDDVIAGGAGADLLTGGAGADRFVFASAAESPPTGADRISDFQQGSDLIDLTALDLQFIGAQAFAGAGQLRLQMSGDHQLLQADLDGDGLADLVIRIDGSTPITLDDLLL